MNTKKKSLSKREDFGRRLASFGKHAFLVMQPTSIAIIITYCWWRFLFKNEIHFHKEEEATLLTGVFLLLSVAYGITAATTFDSVWEKYQSVVKAVLTKNKDEFLLYRDERIPIVLHILIFSFSLPILVCIGGVEYHSALCGNFAVFAGTFVLSLYWIIVTELQDPARSLWFAERIPEDWLTADIDDHFKQGEE